MEIKDRLKYLRKECGLTQNEVAIIIGKSIFAYASYERGRSIPPLETLIVLADFYKVTLDYLALRTDFPHSNPIRETDYQSEELNVNDLIQDYVARTKCRRFSNKDIALAIELLKCLAV